jgi:hypothetical protein
VLNRKEGGGRKGREKTREEREERGNEDKKQGRTTGEGRGREEKKSQRERRRRLKGRKRRMRQAQRPGTGGRKGVESSGEGIFTLAQTHKFPGKPELSQTHTGRLSLL